MSVICSCTIKTEINTEIYEISFWKIFQSTFKNSNFGVIRCYNLVFTLNKLNNIGFFIFSFFVFAHIICFILFFIYGIKSIVLFIFNEMNKNKYITKIHSPKKKHKSFKYKLTQFTEYNCKNENNSGICLNQINESKRVAKKRIQSSKTNNLFLDLNNKDNFDKVSNKRRNRNKTVKIKKPIFIFNYKCDNHYYKTNHKTSTIIKKDKSNIKDLNKKHSILRKNNKLNKENNCPGYYNLIQISANNSKNNAPPESKYILDNYNYEEAIKYDTRDFWRIYFICLLSKENILNTFFFKSSLESQPIRISLFIFSYSCDLALNALFYFNQKISDKYHYKGESLYLFIFINNMIISIFSTVSSFLLVKSLSFLTNSKNSIEILFREEEQKMRKNKKYKVDYNRKKYIYKNILKVYKIMKIKMVCYIIIEFLIMLFFLYFITAFCEVYRETQKSLLLDFFSTFILSIFFELLISFFISFLYTAAIKLKLQFLYNIVLFSYRLR